jgi:hypothetical protein
MTMISADLFISSSALNAIIALAGGMIGTIGAAIAARQALISRRASSLHIELEHALGDVEQRDYHADAVRKAMLQQAEAVERSHRYLHRRRFFYRLLIGYITLATLFLIALAFLIRFQNGLTGEIPYGWFLFGILAAAAGNLAVYVLASIRRIHLEEAVSVGPLTIKPMDSEEAPSAAALERSCAKRLRGEGFAVSRASLNSGFDLFAHRGDEVIAVEVKGGERLTMLAVDALVGAVSRARSTEAAPPARIFLVAPERTLRNTSKAVLQAAESQGIEIYPIAPESPVASLRQEERTSSDEGSK